MNFSFRTISIAATATAAVASAATYPFLPKRVASHFDEDGRADRFSSSASAAVTLPIVMAVMTVVNDRLGGWPGGRDRESPDSGVRARDESVALVELAMLASHAAALANAVDIHLDLDRLNRAVLGGLMVGLGNVMPKLPRNGLIGIRTPWTLADPGVWERTHRVGGYLITAAGLVALASLPASSHRAKQIPTAAMLGALGIAAIYSFLIRAHRTSDR